VLRSVGKFFGLAGARVGFVFAEPPVLDALHTTLGPWTVNGPARWAAAGALEDRRWQREARLRLRADARRLKTLLTARGLPPAGGSALFQWVRSPEAARLHEALARRGILTRLFADPPALRFGLPDAPGDWKRLAETLDSLGTARHRSTRADGPPHRQRSIR